MSGEIRVMVVDDHPVVLDGVRLLLRDDPAITVVGSASSCSEALAVARAEQPDVVLLDLRLPDQMASEVIAPLRLAAPQARLVVFTAYRDTRRCKPPWMPAWTAACSRTPGAP